MKKLLFISTLLLFSFLQFSCSTEGITNNSPTTNPVDVYVAGSKDGQACYWKNGQVVMLNSGGFTESDVIKVVVSSGDIYAFGYGWLNNTSPTNYLFWKNGVLTNLKASFNTSSQIVSSIEDMEIAGNDVYFVGFMKPTLLTVEIYDLVYWKNGIKTVLQNNMTGPGSLKIKAQNNDVYVTLSPSLNTLLSGYYKNNTFYANPNAAFVGIAEVNNQMLVYGGQDYNGFYKNTVSNSNTVVPFINDSFVRNMIFDNNNLYYSNASQIYRNGVLFNETQAPNVLTDFKVANNNLYKIDSAVYGNPNDNQTVLINNNAVLTTTAGDFYNSIFIVQN